MDTYSGEKFLDKLFSNLYTSDEVLHTKENNDKRYEAIRKYLERLEKVHNKANTNSKKELLKSLYYDKYVIKEDVLRDKIKRVIGYVPEDGMSEEINNTINSQKKSLSNWIDYLSSPFSYYPLWAKYWAFQGMLKMGNYDEGIEGYQKRSKDTEGPFIDANPEIIAKAIEIIEQKVNKKDINDDELKKIVSTGSFSKIYTLLEKRYKENVIEYSGTEGIWIKYNQGNKEDALQLYKSLQSKNTHWCTACESVAINQVCGPYLDNKKGGDFYVYYTKDKSGNYTLPRIAIRMINHNEIGEIRGIEEGQNIEEEMESILEEKLNDMTFLSENDKKKTFQKINGLKELTRIYKKVTKNEKLTKEEFNNLYTKEYGFGYVQDPKVTKILKKRNLINDLSKTDDLFIKLTIFKKIIKYYGIDYLKVSNFYLSDDEFIKYCIKNNLAYYAMMFTNPLKVKDYESICDLSTTYDGKTIKFINPKYINNYDKYALNSVKNDNDDNCEAFKSIKKEFVTNYDEIALTCASYNPIVIIWINPEDVNNYEEIAFLVVRKSGSLINFIHKKYVSDYKKLEELANISERAKLRQIQNDIEELTNQL